MRVTLPIGRVVGPAHVVAFAAHVMTNRAATGATDDWMAARRLVPR
jgi:hypothetical protein